MEAPGPNAGILVVRLGAMGDILHALPAVASLKHSFPAAPLTWIVESNWAPLLEGNPFIDRVICLDRRHPGTWMRTRRELRARRYAVAVDFQGLIKSALIASTSRSERIVGFHQSQVRERPAALIYSNRVRSPAEHKVDRNLELASAAGAARLLRVFPLPQGRPEGELPTSGFVLASPFAGWKAKQWPLESYERLANLLVRNCGLRLVLNVPPGANLDLPSSIHLHQSGLPGLIDATRRAVAVIGVDSGPLHLAAAMGRPGVAIFGPTDPARHGPYGGTIDVLRAAGACTTYKRSAVIDPAMLAIAPEQVADALRVQVSCHA